MPFHQRSKISLKAAIILFILMDLTVLAINFWITHQMYEDAVAINLAGRQRMLSQRITKVLLQITPTVTASERQALETELRLSLSTLITTLDAFDKGGLATDGHGDPVTIEAVKNPHAILAIRQAADLIQPTRERFALYLQEHALAIPDYIIDEGRADAVTTNLRILNLMNDLTFDLEQDSHQRTDMLRMVQSAIFLLALLNFIAIIRNMNNQTKQAVAMSQHFSDLAMHDQLTGLYNRRQFDDTLHREARNLNKPQAGFSLLMIDLDGFKSINDSLSHDAGDEVLREVGHRLNVHARAGDTLARLGGDEFALLCPNLTQPEAAKALCQRLIIAISDPIRLSSGQSVHVGASIGIAFYPDHVNDMDKLILAADKAMYHAKQHGRGHCVYAKDIWRETIYT